MERYARQNSTVVSLGQGIPSGRAHSHIHASVVEALKTKDDIDSYSDPQGLLELRQKISSSLTKQSMQYSAAEITVTAGAIEALNSVLLTFVTGQRDEVIVPMPAYSAYERAVACAKGKTIPVMLDEQKNWQLHIAEIAQKISKQTAAVLLCNPNNPTGQVYDKATLLALGQLAKKHNFVLILDEVYGNIIYDDAELYALCVNAEYRKYIVRIVSFSKDFCLTGWRVGYMHADQSIMDQIVPVHDTLINCAPVVSQYAAMAALDIAGEVIRQNKQSYALRMRIMGRCLEDMPEFFAYTTPQGGYFYFPKLPDGVDAREFCSTLATGYGVVAVPGDDFGLGGEGHIRLCFGRSEADILQGMQRIKELACIRC